MKTTAALLALAALLLLPVLAGCGGSTSVPAASAPAVAATRNVTWEGHNPPPVK